MDLSCFASQTGIIGFEKVSKTGDRARGNPYALSFGSVTRNFFWKNQVLVVVECFLSVEMLEHHLSGFQDS